jgi:maltose alpha-D-glucosyltransferase/alpha-amylase
VHLRSGAPTLPFTLAKIRLGSQIGAVVDAARDPEFDKLMVDLIAKGETLEFDGQRIVVERSSARAAALAAAAEVPVEEISPLSGEQSNTSITVGTAGILKFYRQLRDGTQPELEVTQFLTEKTSFEAAPALLGSMELHRADGSRSAVAALFERIENQGDAWSRVTESLARHLRDNAYGEGSATAEPSSEDAASSDPQLILQFDPGETIGRRTGEMHAALATVTGDPAFDPEPLDEASLEAIVTEAKAEAMAALDVLRQGAVGVDPALADDITALTGAGEAIGRWFDGFAAAKPSGMRTRIHGDYHLGQVLVSRNDVAILDFEGEPGRPLEERRAKTSPLRDVAGMLRSYDYAAFAARDKVGPADDATLTRIREMAEGWREATSAEFLKAWEAASGVDLADEGNSALLDLFLLQKAFYELRYEAAMRPAWLSIPLRGIVSLLQKRQVLA